MNTIRDILIGGGSLLVAGTSFSIPRPSPVHEFSITHPQSIAHDMARIATDMKIAAKRHEQELSQMELGLECARA